MPVRFNLLSNLSQILGLKIQKIVRFSWDIIEHRTAINLKHSRFFKNI